MQASREDPAATWAQSMPGGNFWCRIPSADAATGIAISTEPRMHANLIAPSFSGHIPKHGNDATGFPYNFTTQRNRRELAKEEPRIAGTPAGLIHMNEQTSARM
jgi:hypothetical protein